MNRDNIIVYSVFGFFSLLGTITLIMLIRFAREPVSIPFLDRPTKTLGAGQSPANVVVKGAEPKKASSGDIEPPSNNMGAPSYQQTWRLAEGAVGMGSEY